MEPITLCGAVIVAFGLWVEFEPLAKKVARTFHKSAAMTTLMSSTKVPNAGRVLSPCGCYLSREGRSLT